MPHFSTFVAKIMIRTNILLYTVFEADMTIVDEMIPKILKPIPETTKIHQITWSRENPRKIYLSCSICPVSTPCSHYPIQRGYYEYDDVIAPEDNTIKENNDIVQVDQLPDEPCQSCTKNDEVSIKTGSWDVSCLKENNPLYILLASNAVTTLTLIHADLTSVYRILRFDSDEGQKYQNIFDRYTQRPTNLENLSLAEFAVNYEHTSRAANNEEDGDLEAYAELEDGESSRTTIRFLNGNVMKKRRRPAILRTRYYTQMGDRGYFYNYLVAHVPFRDESDLLTGYETCEEAFMAQRNSLRPFHGDSIEQFPTLERELQQGYDPRIADVDIEVEDVEAVIHVNITDEEFHSMVASMNIEQKIFDEVTKRIRMEVTNQLNTNAPLKLFVTGGAGSGKCVCT
ncbi:hypothetical protein ACJJTC_002395 [Scirpophaga incertulas]